MDNKKVLAGFATLVKEVAIRANGATSWCDSYQPVEPESVRKAVENRKQAKMFKKQTYK